MGVSSGYVYAFDDTTSNSGSVGGKVAATVDQANPGPNGIIWSSNGNGGTSSDVVNDFIYGISELSTTSSPNPSTGQVSGQVACNGSTDGACNTNNIYVYYQFNATNAPINLAYYAAGLCRQTISGYSDWYLPAICEMRYTTTLGCGTSAAPTLQNMQANLIEFNSLNLLSGFYWSSTSVASLATFVWEQRFIVPSEPVDGYIKSAEFGVRCSRVLT